MNTIQDAVNIHKGQFLWRSPGEQGLYLKSLRKKISENYFFSETILSKIVEEIAPVIDDAVERELA